MSSAGEKRNASCGGKKRCQVTPNATDFTGEQGFLTVEHQETNIL